MYAVIVREYFPPKEAGMRVGIALMFALFGMALGGWMSGAIFDLTGSYRAAFANGFLWNLLNLAIIGWLLIRSRTWMSGRLAPPDIPDCLDRCAASRRKCALIYRVLAALSRWLMCGSVGTYSAFARIAVPARSALARRPAISRLAPRLSRDGSARCAMHRPE